MKRGGRCGCGCGGMVLRVGGEDEGRLMCCSVRVGCRGWSCGWWLGVGGCESIERG